jgi:hypothetical protein
MSAEEVSQKQGDDHTAQSRKGERLEDLGSEGGIHRMGGDEHVERHRPPEHRGPEHSAQHQADDGTCCGE